MALAFGAIVLDGIREKVCTVTCLDNDAPASIAIDYTANGMTDLPTDPLENLHVVTTYGSDNAIEFAIIGSTATAFTLQKITSAGAGAAMVVRVICRCPRGIAS